MNWKLKALIQNIVNLLPNTLSQSSYYHIQRKYGGLKKANPESRFVAAIEIKKLVELSERKYEGKVYELGTGRRLNIPIANYLMGIDETVTVDLNNYLKEELVKEDINFILKNLDKVKSIFGEHLKQERWLLLLSFLKNTPLWSLIDLMKFCNIIYLPNQDAATINYPKNYFDYSTSFTVLEHIPSDEIIKIFDKMVDVVSDQGLLIHCIDYSDHFEHSDTNISSINFLKYSNFFWSIVADNKFMYMNRMRFDDFDCLFKNNGIHVLSCQNIHDDSVTNMLTDPKFRSSLNSKFSIKSDDVLSTTASWYVMSPAGVINEEK